MMLFFYHLMRELSKWMVKDGKRRLKTLRDPNIFPKGPENPMFFCAKVPNNSNEFLS